MSENILITTFGGFSISYNGKIITDQDNRSKKLWVILEYILAYHDRSISQSSIIDLLWNEDSVTTDPENALKTCLHRVRGLLDALEIPEQKLILRKQGTISWNNSVPCEFDFEIFIDLINKAAMHSIPEEERMEYYDRAFSLYKGEFLPKCTGEIWAVNLATRYHSLFVKMVRDYMTLLDKHGQYDKIVDYCSIAAALDSRDEEINYFLIYGLFKCGNRVKAAECYNSVVNVYYDEFGVEPPKRLLSLYNEISMHEEGLEANLNSIQSDLIEKNASRSAYYCDYSIFQHFYRVMARTCARTGISIFLCLVTVREHTGKESGSGIPIAKAMERLHDTIGNSLRSSDVFSRYSKNQFIIMLPTACYEDSLRIGGRILKNFEDSRPRLDMNVSYAVKCLEPQVFE